VKPIRQALDEFWFEPAPPARLALLRIFVGVYLCWYLVPELDDFVKIAQSDPRLFAPVGVVLHGPVGIELFKWLLQGTLLGAVFFTLGLGHRIVAPLFACLLLWLFCYRQSWSMIYHSDNLVVLHVIVLAVARSADIFSLDAFLRRLRKPATPLVYPDSWHHGWPVKLMCALTVSVYFVTAVAKLAGPLGLNWVSGQALRSQMAVDAIRKEVLGAAPNPVAYGLYDQLTLFTILAAGSMAMEFFAPLALLNRRLGRIWAFNTFLMHWGILLVMRITFHYQLSGLLFASFFRVERILELPRNIGKWRPAAGAREPVSKPAGALVTHPSTQRAILFYDGECGMCDRFVQFVLRHDRREYFQFASLQSAPGREQLARLGLPPNDLKSVILLEAGQAHLRSTAILRVCRRLAGPWPLLYGFSFIPKPWRDGVYSLVARNRKRWFKPAAQCPVMPAEWRRRIVG